MYMKKCVYACLISYDPFYPEVHPTHYVFLMVHVLRLDADQDKEVGGVKVSKGYFAH